MPVVQLFVEGQLDADIVGSFGIDGTVKPGGGKGGLKHRAADAARTSTERRPDEPNQRFGYLRDRDFDTEQQSNATNIRHRVVPIPHVGKKPLAIDEYVWNRHSIENYLIDPVIVTRAFPQIAEADYRDVLRASAQRIRFYEAARWAVAEVRNRFQRIRSPRTRPAKPRGELEIPRTVDADVSRDWARQMVESYVGQIQNAANNPDIDGQFDAFCQRFNDEFCETIDGPIVWFSGKDLIGGMFTESRASWGINNAVEFVRGLRDWVQNNATEAVNTFPEWQALVAHIKE